MSLIECGEIVRTKDGQYYLMKNGRVRHLAEPRNPPGTRKLKAAKRKQRLATKSARRRNRK